MHLRLAIVVSLALFPGLPAPEPGLAAPEFRRPPPERGFQRSFGQSSPRAGAAFGFEVGEERRYLLGPPEALDPGESAVWMIRLDRLRDNGEAVFVFDHHRTGPDSSGGTPAYGEELDAEMDGELVVNEHGFPMRVEFDARRSFYGYGDDSYHVRYEFNGRDWDKQADTFGKQWDIAVPISGHRNLDKSVPIGLYLFLPDAFECVGYRPSVARVQAAGPRRLSPGGGLSPAASMPRVDRFAQTCEPDTDLGFLNPGLLSLAWPALLEEDGGGRDFLFFTPTGADLFPGPRTSMMLGGGGVGVASGGPPSQGGGIGRARDPRRYYAYSEIELRESTTVRLRGRSLEAVAARIRGLPGTAYFDADGKALLIEIDATRFIETGVRAALSGTVSVDPGDLERRHVRLMFPSEY